MKRHAKTRSERLAGRTALPYQLASFLSYFETWGYVFGCFGAPIAVFLLFTGSTLRQTLLRLLFAVVFVVVAAFIGRGKSALLNRTNRALVAGLENEPDDEVATVLARLCRRKENESGQLVLEELVKRWIRLAESPESRLTRQQLKVIEALVVDDRERSRHAVDALLALGDEETLRVLERKVKFVTRRGLADQVNAGLPAMRERLAQQENRKLLLRPAAEPSAEELLHTGGAADDNPNELLRPGGER